MPNVSEAMKASSLSTLTITVVYDNNAGNADLETAWGFSCVIQGLEETILFDTGGNGDILLTNMQKVGIDPEEVDLVVLSHIHGDHVGGLADFLKKNKEVNVYLPHSFPTSLKNDVKHIGATVAEVQESLKISRQVYSSGELGTSIKEQALIVQTAKGLIIITGCAHPGIVNMVERTREIMRDDVLLVMGGFHLGGHSMGALEKIVSDFKALGVQYVGPCHCSGDMARQAFKHAYQAHFIPIGVGTVIALEDIIATGKE
ncbi:MAG: MBL fold metallo-hydrolase [Candidatus Vecturithrix sp.]|nr:MBL fold metallo-hydrolase [Candidatus Vecturithrix sp.]